MPLHATTYCLVLQLLYLIPPLAAAVAATYLPTIQPTYQSTNTPTNLQIYLACDSMVSHTVPLPTYHPTAAC